jgi:Flp pilus assembly protein protease CpaA
MINLSKPIKKRKISNKLFLLIFISYVLIVNIYEHMFTFIAFHLNIILGIIGFIMFIDGIDRYIDYIRKKRQDKNRLP